MDNTTILETLKTERAKVLLQYDTAIAALGGEVVPTRRRGTKEGTRRKMSPESRERIAAAQRKRWASRRKEKATPMKVRKIKTRPITKKTTKNTATEEPATVTAA